VKTNPKTTVVALAVAAALAVPLAAQQPAQPPSPASGKGPRIAVEPPSFNFGEALKGKELAKEFSIRNFGNEDLLIQGVTTTCGCTVADGYARVVKPGGSTPLQVKLRTQGTGRIVKSVLVKTNDPTKAIYELKVEASVVDAAK